MVCLDAISNVASQLGLGGKENVLQGREYQAILIARALRGELMHLLGAEPQPTLLAVCLTENELTVLKWGAKGKSVGVTAQLMGISEKRVQKCRESAGKKLNSRSITQSVVAATRLGLI